MAFDRITRSTDTGFSCSVTALASLLSDHMETANQTRLQEARDRACAPEATSHGPPGD